MEFDGITSSYMGLHGISHLKPEISAALVKLSDRHIHFNEIYPSLSGLQLNFDEISSISSQIQQVLKFANPRFGRMGYLLRERCSGPEGVLGVPITR